MADLSIDQRTDHIITIDVGEDVTGATAEFIIAKSVSGEPLVTVAGVCTGQSIVVTLSTSDTDIVGVRYHETRLTDTANKQTVPSSGTITFNQTNAR
jgi:hypothetical protein